MVQRLTTCFVKTLKVLINLLVNTAVGYTTLQVKTGLCNSAALQRLKVLMQGKCSNASGKEQTSEEQVPPLKNKSRLRGSGSKGQRSLLNNPGLVKDRT